MSLLLPWPHLQNGCTPVPPRVEDCGQKKDGACDPHSLLILGQSSGVHTPSPSMHTSPRFTMQYLECSLRGVLQRARQGPLWARRSRAVHLLPEEQSGLGGCRERGTTGPGHPVSPHNKTGGQTLGNFSQQEVVEIEELKGSCSNKLEYHHCHHLGMFHAFCEPHDRFYLKN